MRVRTALRSSSTNYSIAAPCVHLAAHAVSCVWGRAVRFVAQLCWCIWQRPSRSAAYDAAGDGACGSGVAIQRHLPDQAGSLPVQRLRHAKEKDCGTNFRVQCEAVSQMQNEPTLEGNRRGKPRDSRCALCLPVGDASFGGGIGVTLGEGDMANRLRFIAGCFPSIFLMSGLADARAADPGFCRQFAKAAISQVRGALADPRCGAGVQGARWSTDFAAHYEWCLGASPAAAGADRDARTRVLRACTSR
jgi:hypothetical protein